MDANLIYLVLAVAVFLGATGLQTVNAIKLGVTGEAIFGKDGSIELNEMITVFLFLIFCFVVYLYFYSI